MTASQNLPQFERLGLPRCGQCGAPKYMEHPYLGSLCWWHSRLKGGLR